MDFNETPDDQEIEPIVANDEPQVDVDVNPLLRVAGKRIKNIQTRIGKALADIAAEIDNVRGHVSSARLTNYFASEFGIDKADSKLYLRISSKMENRTPLLADCGMTFPVVKALTAAPSDVQETAIEHLNTRGTLMVSDIAAMKRRSIDEKTAPEVKRDRRRQKALREFSVSLAATRRAAFFADFRAFAQTLVDFYNGEQPKDSKESRQDWLDNTRAKLMAEASNCLVRFEEIFDVASFPPPWEYNYHVSPDEAVSLARAHDSLKSLAAGEFQEWDHEQGNPVDKRHEYIDVSLVESVVWLFEDVETSKMGMKDVVATNIPATAKVIKPPHRLLSLEICAGAGGQAIGLHAAGFHAEGIYERNKSAVKTLKANPALGRVHNADITAVDFRRYRGEVALVAGGVPCQGHSSIGKMRGREDERDLFLEAVRIVDEVRPRAFFFENVKGFNFEKNTSYRAELHDKFAALGYESQVFSLLGSDLGLAQDRPRVAFVGFRDGLMSRFRMPPAFPQWRTTVGEVLYDLVAERGWKGVEHWAKSDADHIGPTIVGGSEQSGRLAFSSNLRADAWIKMGIDPMGLADEAPGPDHKGLFKFTLRMGARLQGFPDEWEFRGPAYQQKRQIANALPPIMARAVGLAIYSALTGIEFDIEKALQQPLLAPWPKQKEGEPLKLAAINLGHEELEDA
jgi:DNA (cytosine-5)-methyltransferase 1